MAEPVKPESVNQPSKLYPARDVVKLFGSASAVLVVKSVTAEPELVTKVTVNGLAVHFAQRVKFAVLPCV